MTRHDCMHDCCAQRHNPAHRHTRTPEHCLDCPQPCDHCTRRLWLAERHHHDGQVLCGRCCPTCREDHP